ncbi:MAG: methylated-DNA--[protein]-cysteine S-methyltransferase [Bacilli bacterium]|nr:methylated-DNA--[protein]-cysteine S-methyltransferase [Bacilli bacterium]
MISKEIEIFAYHYIINDIDFVISQGSNNIVGVIFSKNLPLYSIKKETPLIKLCANQINEYMNRVRKEFNLPILYNGTPFQMKVWNNLQKIPYGKQISYKDLAIMIGNPKSYRAVGNAVHNNNLVIIIPCHRVIKNNGDIGGFGGGEEIKKRLLDIEKS